MNPSSNGGINWSPVAIDPYQNLAYALVIEQALKFYSEPSPYPGGKRWLGGNFSLDTSVPQWGYVVAVDYNSGGIRWKVKTQQPMIGGILATAGGLVFTGEGNGLFKAYNSTNGELLWQYEAKAGVNAPPASYNVKGKQYIVVAAGGNAHFDYPRGNEILAFTLPDS